MIEPMPRAKPIHLHSQRTRHGKLVWYVRQGKGPRIRLRSTYGCDAFWQEYRDALAGRTVTPAAPKKAATGTLAWLAGQYKASAAFARLAPSTRRVRDNLLKTIVEKSGHHPIAAVDRKNLIAARDRRAERPEAANAYLKVMRAMFGWALVAELVDSDPTREVPFLSTGSDGFHTWSIDEVERFQARHAVGTKARLAMDLMLFTGLRRSDIVRVGRQHVRDDVISIRTQKTGETVHVPILSPLQASLDAAETGDMTFIVTEFGQAYTPEGFGNWFRRRCREASVPGSAHGLRKAGATIAAENGATTHQLMAIFGWRTTKEAERYTRNAERRRLSIEAAEKLIPGHSANGKSLTPNQGEGNRRKSRVKSTA